MFVLPVKGFPHQNVEPLELCLTEWKLQIQQEEELRYDLYRYEVL